MDAYSFSRTVATVAGVLWLSWLLLRLLKTFLLSFNAFFLAPWGFTRTNLKKHGPWAVVTGASEGIGRGYGLELARQGLNVVIISRSKEKLKKVADEIREKYGREVRIITADFTKGLEVYPNIKKQLKDLDIGVLVNNVGISTKYPDYVHSIDSTLVHNITEVNSQAMVQMTKLVLPSMLAKKKGVIVNISSSLGLLHEPLVAVYSATKSFAISFSDGLRKECANQGITVQCVIPLLVMTSLSSNVELKRPTFLTPDPVSFAKAAVATIGIVNLTRGCFGHALQGFFLDNILPSFIVDWSFFVALKRIRANGLKKLQQTTAKDK